MGTLGMIYIDGEDLRPMAAIGSWFPTWHNFSIRTDDINYDRCSLENVMHGAGTAPREVRVKAGHAGCLIKYSSPCFVGSFLS